MLRSGKSGFGISMKYDCAKLPAPTFCVDSPPPIKGALSLIQSVSYRVPAIDDTAFCDQVRCLILYFIDDSPA